MDRREVVVLGFVVPRLAVQSETSVMSKVVMESVSNQRGRDSI
jgi:hypothetical protein